MSLHWWQWWWLRTVAMVARVIMIMVITVFLTVSDDHNPTHASGDHYHSGWCCNLKDACLWIPDSLARKILTGVYRFDFLLAFWHLLHISMVNRLVSFAFGKIWCFLCKRTTLLELTRVGKPGWFGEKPKRFKFTFFPVLWQVLELLDQFCGILLFASFPLWLLAGQTEAVVLPSCN